MEKNMDNSRTRKMDHNYIGVCWTNQTWGHIVAFDASDCKFILHHGQFKVDANKAPTLFNFTYALENWQMMKKI
jgi:hypothetical protein